jgi:hypothetical protein
MSAGKEQATVIDASGAGDGESTSQVARMRAMTDRTPGTASLPAAGRGAAWSLRAGESIRRGAAAVISRPRTWGVWDWHPASSRVVVSRVSQVSGYTHPSILVRWPFRAGAALIAAWSVFFCTLAVAPRSKTCWIVAAVAIACVLTWRH